MQNMDFLRIERQIPILLAFLLLAGCSTTEPTAPQTVSPLNLAGYATQMVPVKPAPAIPTAQPVSTVPAPTPSAYTVKQGDTLLEIAQRDGISLAELLAANPGIAPEALSVGQVIQIPAARLADSLPTPAAAELGAVACFPSGGGTYCLVPVHNPGMGSLENVKVQVTLLDAEDKPVASQEALPPLTILPAGKTLPAAAFFPGGGTSTSQQAQLVTAISTAGERYLPAEIRNLLVGIAWGSLSAQAQGQVSLPTDSKPASVIWLAGVAYDADENIVGFRRWEWSGSLKPGEMLPFSFAVYSTGAPIERVEVLVEARP
jgi:LysM repeat protein